MEQIADAFQKKCCVSSLVDCIQTAPSFVITADYLPAKVGQTRKSLIPSHRSPIHK